jgi:hypothetical protein
MERSGTTLIDFDIHVSPDTGTRLSLCHEDIILLLADFTRVRSLSLTGHYHTIHPIIDSLRRSLPVQSLSLCIGFELDFILPDDLFGGKAPIRRLQLVGDGHIVAPHWLLRGVTHFTSGESIALAELLNVLRNMSALAYFEFRGCLNEERASPIQMPQLTNLTVRT